MNKAWVGVDAGKEFHWAHVLDASGTELLSRKVENDEADIGRLIDEALSLAEGLVWAVDQPGGSAALLLALLWERDQRVLYVPGLTVDRARDAYRGESKTDARDARVIADQVANHHLDWIRVDYRSLAFATELPPKTASVIHDPRHAWRDADWLARRVLDSQISGRRVEPREGEVIRSVGQYDNGKCVLPPEYPIEPQY